MSQAVRTALYSKLTGGTALTAHLAGTAAVYHAQAPQDADFPLVIFHKQAGTPTYTFKRGEAAFEEQVWLIKGVDRSGSSNTVDAIAQHLSSLLTDGSLSISGYSQMYLRRESDVEYVETFDGAQYRHAGGLYRLVYRP